MTTATAAKLDIHTYYNTLVTASFLNVSSVPPCHELLDSGRCSFDYLGNVTAIDGRTITKRDGANFSFK